MADLYCTTEGHRSPPRGGRRIRVLSACAVLVLLGIGLLPVPTAGDEPPPGPAMAEPVGFDDFAEIAPLGFGDENNSGAWSMQWWNGKLYVGTVREFDCWTLATLANEYPELFDYPPRDPDKECTPDVQDLSLQAEIWRYTPETGAWERVFQSPKDVPIPDKPGKFTARDVGFRDMTVFVEPDGTEALYVSALYPQIINPLGYPRPRILRSTDGVNFEAIPMDPGTFLGDLDNPGFRGLVSYKDRLYVIASSTIWGAGIVLESANPRLGNDSFSPVTPPDMLIFELLPYNGYLYVGTSSRNPEPPIGAGYPLPSEIPVELTVDRSWPRRSIERVEGYSVLRTDATGDPPYQLEAVVTEGGYRRNPPEGVASMAVHDGSLYVGTDYPAEIIRIHPDDTWDLIVGDKRDTPDGWKWPLSGIEAGFDWFFNIHVWRMQSHEGTLYVGTCDMSTWLHNNDEWRQQYGDRMGFDLYASRDGVTFVPVTVGGMGNMFHMGARTFTSTPHGLFLGSVNYWEGLGVWVGARYARVYLPLVRAGSAD